MTDTFGEAYPETAPYIEQAVDGHGKAWVLENYYQKRYPLGQVMNMPDKEALPFYDPDEHETMTEGERTEMYQAWAAYRENLRNASERTK
jgi:hypothetical protein